MTTNKTKSVKLPSSPKIDRKEIERAILLLISSSRSSDEYAGNEDPPLFTSSQIDTDFTVATQCEAEGDLSMDDMDHGFFDLFRSSTYWKLREAFVKAALAGDEYAFMTAVWRGYNAGRVSPDRFVANTKKERESRTASEVTSAHAIDARATSRRAKEARNAK